MKSLETIQEFYKTRHNWIPSEIRSNIGHFNVFKLDPFIGKNAKPLEYRRRDWYNITLVYGSGRLNYAEQAFEFKRPAIAFTNPQVPFSWEKRDQMTGGYYCIFNKQFLQKDTSIIEYPLFQPGNIPLYELTDKQAKVAEQFFQRLFKEINSDYKFKYDIVKIIIAELLHFTMKLRGFEVLKTHSYNSSERITIQFLDILERQFPIDNPMQNISFRSASDFANHLNVHVNHLNRAVKEATQKTTTQLIAERVLQEAEILLKHTKWNISEIAFSLGFTEPAHFNNFFKKNTRITPLQFRNI